MTELPGADLVAKGLRDLARGEETVESLLVAIAAPRLRSCGVAVPADTPDDAELRLYRLLRRVRPEDAYSFYNSLIRRLVSYEDALEAQHTRRAPPTTPR